MNTASDYIKVNLKADKLLEAYNFFVGMSTMYYITRLYQIPNFASSKPRWVACCWLAKSLFLRSKYWKRVSLQSKTVCLIINFKQYSSLERQKRNKKTCNTYFCLTVKRVIAEAWCDNYFSFLFSFGFTKPETRSTWKILWRVGCNSQKNIDRCLLEIVLAWLVKSWLKWGKQC